MPGVVRPVAPTLRLLRTNLPNPGVQQRIDTAVHTGVTHFTDDAENRHTRTMLKAARTGALHHFNHLWRISLLAQPPCASLTRVARRDDDHGFCGIGECGIPGYAKHVV